MAVERGDRPLLATLAPTAGDAEVCSEAWKFLAKACGVYRELSVTCPPPSRWLVELTWLSNASEGH